MELFLAWLLMASVQLAATMSPGPAFVFTVKNAMTYDRVTGIATSFGLALGVMAHVILVIAGISIIIAQSIVLYNVIKYCGAAYLVYIGLKSLTTKKQEKIADKVNAIEPVQRYMSLRKAIFQGFMTNMLNPKAVVFFTAVFAQFITPSTPFIIHALYGATSVMIEFVWFFGVAIVLTNPVFKERFTKIMHWIDRVCGGLMIGLGVKLALTK